MKISLKEYMTLMFDLFYRKVTLILLLVLDLLLIAWVAIYYLHLADLPKPLIYQFITISLITVVQPLIYYFTVKKNYFSSAHLMEELKVTFSNDKLILEGESFYTEYLWKKMFKVLELKNWFLIYQNSLAATIIPKKSFTSAQAEELRTLLKSFKNLNLKLMDSST